MSLKVCLDRFCISWRSLIVMGQGLSTSNGLDGSFVHFQVGRVGQRISGRLFGQVGRWCRLIFVDVEQLLELWRVLSLLEHERQAKHGQKDDAKRSGQGLKILWTNNGQVDKLSTNLYYHCQCWNVNAMVVQGFVTLPQAVVDALLHLVEVVLKMAFT